MESSQMSPIEEINQKIQILKDKNNLSESSISYLSKQLNNFSSDYLSDGEEKIIRNQIEYHQKLKELKDEYKNSKQKITKRAQTFLNEKFEEYETQTLGKGEISIISGKLDEEEDKLEDNIFNSSYRDHIESSINILNNFGINNHWETNEVSKFLDVFTIEYINFLEDEGKLKLGPKDFYDMHKKLKDEGKKVLYITEKQLGTILTSTLTKIQNKNTNLKIEFSIVKDHYIKKVIINLADKVLEVEKESNKKVFINFINGVNVQEQIKKMKKILGIEGEINESKLKQRYINYLLIEKMITKNELLIELEKETGFNYLNFLEKYGLTKLIEENGIKLIEETLDIKVNEKNREKLLHNLKIFIYFIIDIESNGLNIDNKKRSSAKGYFQYLNGNGGDRTKGIYSSFETALRRCYIYYTGINNVPIENFTNDKNLPLWVIESYNNKNKTGGKYDPKDLSAENQTLLFLVDIFKKKGTNDYLKNMLVKANKGAMIELYKQFHHTGVVTPNIKTRINLKFDLLFKKFQFLRGK